jgi:glycine/D-amino acid oxidase-like deaminating enzyme
MKARNQRAEVVKTIHSTEVVVIGAGAVGCSIAYWLAKRGKDVALVDRGGPGAGTSMATSGLVWSSYKEPYTYMELNLRSSLLWPKMVEELGEDVELRQDRGGVKLCLTEEDYINLEALAERQRRSPLFKGRMLSPQEVFELQPGVSRQIVGGLWSPHDGDANPIKWVFALVRGCKRLGVKIMRDAEVNGFDLDESNRVKGVFTSRGRIETEYAVNAGGAWAGRLAEMVGVTLGLYASRGQMLVSERAPIVCPTPMSILRQVPDGHFHMGVTYEGEGFEVSSTLEAAEQLAKNAIKMVPLARSLSVIRHFAGLRPMPRDGLPFLGPIPHVPGYYVAVSHSGNTLSAIHGKIISDLIVDGHTDVPIADYDPLRFDERGKGEGHL